MPPRYDECNIEQPDVLLLVMWVSKDFAYVRPGSAEALMILKTDGPKRE